MAASPQIETVSTGADKAKLALVVALLVAGIAGFYLLAKQGVLVQWAILIVAIVAAAAVHVHADIFGVVDVRRPACRWRMAAHAAEHRPARRRRQEIAAAVMARVSIVVVAAAAAAAVVVVAGIL